MQTGLIESATRGASSAGEVQCSGDLSGSGELLLLCEICDALIRVVVGAARSSTALCVTE
jgi:hypothetical protein